MTDVDGTGDLISQGPGHAAHQAAEVATALAVAEVAAVVAMAAQAALHVQERQLHAQADQTTRRRAELRANQAAARAAWAAAFKPAFLSAGPLDAARVWSAAQPWAAHHPAAADATRLAELRLDELTPDLMARYRELLTAGTEPALAMHTAATSLDAAAAAWARANEHSATAATRSTTAHNRSTRPDEHHQSVADSASQGDQADASATRAAALAALAYPQPITAGLAVQPFPGATHPELTAHRQATPPRKRLR